MMGLVFFDSQKRVETKPYICLYFGGHGKYPSPSRQAFQGCLW